MYVCFFASPPSAAAVKESASLGNDTERLVIKAGAGYVYYANGMGKAKLTSALIERKLGTVTVRNWNTVTALLKMAQPKGIA